MLEILMIPLILGVLASQGAVWYKLGRVESKLDSHLTYHTGGAHDPGDDPETRDSP